MSPSLSSHMFDKGIVESEFCENRCRYSEKGFCKYYQCKLSDIEGCELFTYDETNRCMVRL